MSELPESIQCDRCELKAWLRKKKKDGTPFYVCKNEHFTNVGDDKPKQPQGEWKTVSRVSKVPCPCCGAEIIVDVHASSLGVVKKKEQAQARTYKKTELEEQAENEDIPDDGIPF